MMLDDDDEPINPELSVKARLGALGFDVDFVATAEQERPDLLASKDGSRMVVEVKTRTEDRQLRKAMESVKLGETRAVFAHLDKHNSISAHVEKANRQLSSIAEASDFRLLWFQSDSGLFVHDGGEQIAATLLGVRMLCVVREGMPPEAMYCFYADRADFFRYREIDGAMVEVDGDLTLFLNEFSPRRLDFAESPIARTISPHVVSVLALAREGCCYVIDADVDRKDDAVLLEFLRSK